MAGVAAEAGVGGVADERLVGEMVTLGIEEAAAAAALLAVSLGFHSLSRRLWPFAEPSPGLLGAAFGRLDPTASQHLPSAASERLLSAVQTGNRSVEAALEHLFAGAEAAPPLADPVPSAFPPSSALPWLAMLMSVWR